MATKHTDTCLQKAADDEPIFVLRAQDFYAPRLVRDWALWARCGGQRQDGSISDALQTKIDEALALADEMEKWPRRKYPD